MLLQECINECGFRCKEVSADQLHISKIRQHTQKNKSIQEQLNPEDSTSISSALENIASGLHVRGQKVELQSIKDALHKMDKNVLE